jgi:hypothetical protein
MRSRPADAPTVGGWSVCCSCRSRDAVPHPRAGTMGTAVRLRPRDQKRRQAPPPKLTLGAPSGSSGTGLRTHAASAGLDLASHEDGPTDQHRLRHPVENGRCSRSRATTLRVVEATRWRAQHERASSPGAAQTIDGDSHLSRTKFGPFGSPTVGAWSGTCPSDPECAQTGQPGPAERAHLGWLALGVRLHRIDLRQTMTAPSTYLAALIYSRSRRTKKAALDRRARAAISAASPAARRHTKSKTR